MDGRDVIVIGGSAGAIEALIEILAGLPPDLPASLLVAIHRGPTQPGVLPRMLERCGRLAAQYAVDGEAYEHGGIYVAPPDHHLLVSAERLRVTRGPREHGLRPAVDPLFRSAARELGPRVIGVILSGALDDGSEGLSLVKQHGGIAIVQRTEDARHVDMPASALERVPVDHVLPAAGIGSVLSRLVRESVTGRPPCGIPDAAAAGAQGLDGPPPPGMVQPITCPECGGALWHASARKQDRFRCHLGHAFTTRTLAALQDGRLERALWSALRNLEESAALRRRLAERAKGGALPELAALYEAQAVRAQERADMLRALLVDADPLPQPAEAPEEMIESVPTAQDLAGNSAV
jgi:two-component system, chemotaxis family, protein-glutamate methylesterase/glutaminase